VINALFMIAMASLLFSFGVFIVMATERLLRTPSRHATRTLMLLALLSLAITAGLGLYLAMSYSDAAFPLARQLTSLHLSWGLLGWVGLLIMAVAYQVIPMFQITNPYPLMLQRWLGWLICFALITLSLIQIWPLAILKTISHLLLAICLLIFALTTFWLLHTRRRQLPDLTLNFWRLAMVSLALTALIGLSLSVSGMKPPALLLGVLIIHGFAMTTVNGMMYKIMPFLIWLHLSSRNKTLRDNDQRASQIKVPHMRKIIPEAAGLWQFRAHLASLILLLLTALWPQWFFYPATVLFVIAQALLLFNLSSAVRFYRAKLAELASG
jgi:hypothetical protein